MYQIFQNLKGVCILVFVVNEENLSKGDQLIMKFIPAKNYQY